MPSNKKPELFTVQEYAEFKGCTRGNIYNLIKENKLKIVWKQPYVEFYNKKHPVGKPVQFVKHYN